MSVQLPGRSSVPTVAAFVADDVANASLSDPYVEYAHEPSR
jgi:hypothetical protein